MHDLIVVGGGPVGFAGAMYAARLGLKTLVLAGSVPGGLLNEASVVENYPGFKSVSGAELNQRIREHAESYSDFVQVKQESAVKIEKKGKAFKVNSKEGAYEARALLLATGTEYRKLDVPQHDAFLGKGVHYCALCDAFFYKNKVVGVVGGSDAAAKEALVLAGVAKKVFIIYRKERVRAEEVNMKRLEAFGKKVEIINNANVVGLKGGQGLESVLLDRDFNGSRELRLDGLFVAVGREPRSELAQQLGVALNDKKEIVVNRESATSAPGVWAAGDVTDFPFKQVITGVSQAVAAAHSAHEFLQTGQK